MIVKYKLTPQDIADYMFYENITHKREIEILLDLFDNHNDMIIFNYRDNYLKLKQKVYTLLNIYELNDYEYSEAERILQETAGAKELYSYDEEDCFGEYFKFIWLQLMYSGITCRKMKLRNLLKDFGYKKRTYELTCNINHTLTALGLKTYLRRHAECNIFNVKLDDMIIIRLVDQDVNT